MRHDRLDIHKLQVPCNGQISCHTVYERINSCINCLVPSFFPLSPHSVLPLPFSFFSSYLGTIFHIPCVVGSPPLPSCFLVVLSNKLGACLAQGCCTVNRHLPEQGKRKAFVSFVLFFRFMPLHTHTPPLPPILFLFVYCIIIRKQNI